MSTNDYVKYVTQQLVSYIDSPKEERMNKKMQRKSDRPPFLNRWFGMLPFAVMLLFRNKNKLNK